MTPVLRAVDLYEPFAPGGTVSWEKVVGGNHVLDVS